MAKRIHYPPFIRRLVRVLTSGKWELKITLLWATDGIMNMRSFTVAALYHPEDDADLRGIAYGQRIIDENVLALKFGLYWGKRTPRDGGACRKEARGSRQEWAALNV